MNYGKLAKNSDSSITISMEGRSSKISNLIVKAGCGCTTTVTSKVGDKYFINLEYDTTRVGEFSKTVIFSFNQNSQLFRITGKLQGKI